MSAAIDKEEYSSLRRTIMPSKLDSVLTSKAITALFEYEDKKLRDKGKENLIGIRSKTILAQVQLKNMIKKAVLRPVRVKIPHSLSSEEGDDNSVCLFCKTEEKTSLEGYLGKHPVEGLTKLLSVSDVKKRYPAQKDRKQLLSEHTHFISDASVLTQLYSLLGKTFTDRNTYPIPISFASPEKIKHVMVKVLSSSYMHLKGQTITIRLGLTTMSIEDVTSNTVEGLEFAIAKLKNTWGDVHSIHLKTLDSPALPVYSKVPSEVLRYVKRKANIEEDPPKIKPDIKTSQRRAKVNQSKRIREETAVVEGLILSTSVVNKKRGRKMETELSIDIDNELRPKCIKRIKSTTIKR